MILLLTTLFACTGADPKDDAPTDDAPTPGTRQHV